MAGQHSCPIPATLSLRLFCQQQNRVPCASRSRSQGGEGPDGDGEDTAYPDRGQHRKGGLPQREMRQLHSFLLLGFVPVCLQELPRAPPLLGTKGRSFLSLTKGGMSPEQLATHRRLPAEFLTRSSLALGQWRSARDQTQLTVHRKEDRGKKRQNAGPMSTLCG